MTNRIVRLTRHEASATQLAELRRIFGEDAEVGIVSETLPNNTREAVARFDEVAAEADIVEAVLPMNLLEAVLKFSAFSKGGGVIVRAITQRNLHNDGTTTFDFQNYERIVKIEVITERL